MLCMKFGNMTLILGMGESSLFVKSLIKDFITELSFTNELMITCGG